MTVQIDKYYAMKKRKTIIRIIGLLIQCFIFFVGGLTVFAETETEPILIKVACVGDSITFGAGIMDSLETDTYPAHLEKLLGINYEVRNFGLNGATLIREADFPYTESDLYQDSKDYMADIYLIMLGTNDTKPHNWSESLYKEELAAMVMDYQRTPANPEIVLMIPPKCFNTVTEDHDGSIIRDTIIEDPLREVISEVAFEEGIEVLDLYEYTENHPDWFSDGLHPNIEGNRMIAEYIFEQYFQQTR